MKSYAKLKSLCILASFVLASAGARAGLVNGDFEAGGLSGWSTFTTGNGTLGPVLLPQVAPFDIDGDAVPSNAVKMSVGYASAPCSYPGIYCPLPTEGGGIRQKIYFSGGDFAFSARVAVQNTYTLGGYNREGGHFSLILDGLTLDTFSVDRIDAGTIQRGLLSYSGFIGAGLHTLDLLVTRNYAPSQSLFQYVDDVRVARIPEPATLLLAAIASLSLALVGRRARI